MDHEAFSSGHMWGTWGMSSWRRTGLHGGLWKCRDSVCSACRACAHMLSCTRHLMHIRASSSRADVCMMHSVLHAVNGDSCAPSDPGHATHLLTCHCPTSAPSPVGHRRRASARARSWRRTACARSSCRHRTTTTTACARWWRCCARQATSRGASRRCGQGAGCLGCVWRKWVGHTGSCTGLKRGFYRDCARQ